MELQKNAMRLGHSNQHGHWPTKIHNNVQDTGDPKGSATSQRAKTVGYKKHAVGDQCRPQLGVKEYII